MKTTTQHLRLAMHNALLGASKDTTLPMINAVLFADHGRGQTVFGTNRYLITRTNLTLQPGHEPLACALQVNQARLLDRFLGAVAEPKGWVNLNVSQDGQRLNVTTERNLAITLPLTMGTVPKVAAIFDKHEPATVRGWTKSALGFNTEYLGQISKLRSDAWNDTTMVFHPGKERGSAMMFKLGDAVDGVIMPVRVP